MRTELFGLVFSVAELKVATLRHCRAAGDAIPDESIPHLSFDAESPLVVRLQFSSAAGHWWAMQAVLDADQVTAALRRYCRDRGQSAPSAQALAVVLTSEGGIALVSVPDAAGAAGDVPPQATDRSLVSLRA